MQKKLIALAVATLAAGSAFAQSNVAISGYVSSGYASTSYNGSTGGTNNGTEQGVIDSRLSRIRFTGTEDLGGGLKAEFQIESRFMTDTSDSTAGLGQVGVGDDFVGLNGGWGRVRIGRMDTYYADGILTELSRATTFQSHATLSLLTQVGGAHNYIAGAGRWNNEIRYDSPRMSGFAGTVAYSSNRSAEDGAAASNGDAGGAWYASANYFGHGVYAGLSAFNSKTEGTTVGAKNDGYRLYGSYTFPFGLKVGLNYDHGKSNTGSGVYQQRNAWFLPVTYSFGANSIYASYGKAGKTKTNTGTTPDTGAKFYNLGYDYALSKRTSVGVNYTVLDNKAASTYNLLLGGVVKGLGQVQGSVAGQNIKQFAVSMNHSF